MSFGTFLFPDSLSPDISADDYANDPRAVTIAVTVERLVELRARRLNPLEWVKWVGEPVLGYPKRSVTRDEVVANYSRPAR